MDEIERAQQREAEFREDALARMKRLDRSEKPIEPRDCADCWDNIPIERLRAVPDALRCFPCQYRFEEIFRR